MKGERKTNMYDGLVFRSNRRICRMVSLLSLLICMYVAFFTQTGSGYEYYWIIPAMFSLLLFFSPVLNYTDFTNVGPLVLAYTMTVKYAISPLLSCIAGYESRLGIYPSVANLHKAVFLTLYELVAIYIVCVMCTKKYSRRIQIQEAEVEPMHRYWVHFLLIIIGFGSFFLVPSAFIDYRFIFNQNDLAANIIITAPGAGVFRTFYIIARYSLIILITNFFYRRNLKRKSIVNVIGAFVPIMINCIHVSNLSRISILVPMVIGVSLSTQFFSDKKEKRTIIVFCVGIGIAFLVVLSFLKFFGTGRGDASNASSIAWWADTVNMYFTGVKETAVGCAGEEIIHGAYGYNRLALLINDLLSNVSLLSNLSDPMRGTVRLYNTAYFGRNIISQIPPNVTAGSYYFSSFFAGLWPALFVWLSYHFTYKCKTKHHLDERFVFTFPAIWCGLVLMISTTMIFANSVNVALFYGITLLFNRKIVLWSK